MAGGIPIFTPKRQWSAPTGFVEDTPGRFLRRRPHPSGYVEEDSFTRDWQGNIRNRQNTRYNPRQVEMDTERQRLVQAQQMTPPEPQPQNMGGYAMASLRSQTAPAPAAAPEDMYEDYVDPNELARLVEQARGSFTPMGVQRSEQYLDEEMLAKLKEQAEQTYQFTPETYVDNPEARRMGFGRTKDRVGMVSRAALDSLREQMADRGMTGSSVEGSGMSELIASGAGKLGDVIAEQESERAAAIAAVNQRNAEERARRAAQLAGMQPALTQQSMRERLVSDPAEEQRQLNAWLAGLMPTLVSRVTRKRKVANQGA